MCKSVRVGGATPLVHLAVPFFTRDQDRQLVPLIGEGGGRLADAVRAHVVTDEHAAAAAAVEDAGTAETVASTAETLVVSDEEDQ